MLKQYAKSVNLCVAGTVHGTSWELEKVRGNAVMAMLTLAIISVVPALQVFGKDRLVFWRESESGESFSCDSSAWEDLHALLFVCLWSSCLELLVQPHLLETESVARRCDFHSSTLL